LKTGGDLLGFLVWQLRGLWARAAGMVVRPWWLNREHGLMICRWNWWIGDLILLMEVVLICRLESTWWRAAGLVWWVVNDELRSTSSWSGPVKLMVASLLGLRRRQCWGAIDGCTDQFGCWNWRWQLQLQVVIDVFNFAESSLYEDRKVEERWTASRTDWAWLKAVCEVVSAVESIQERIREGMSAAARKKTTKIKWN
jgi:hypothetical protein